MQLPGNTQGMVSLCSKSTLTWCLPGKLTRVHMENGFHGAIKFAQAFFDLIVQEVVLSGGAPTPAGTSIKL